jgi:hypothetical protein
MSKFVFILKSVVFVISFTISFAQNVESWEKQVVEGSPYFSPYDTQCYSEIDEEGTYHLAYGYSEIFYATRTQDSEWHTESVGSDIGVRVFGIILSSQGVPHIFYYHYKTLSLTRAFKSGDIWRIETIEEFKPEMFESEWGLNGCSAALDSSDNPHLTYFLDRRLYYLRYDGSIWKKEFLGYKGQIGGYVKICLDSLGRPHIGYVYTNFQTDIHIGYTHYDGLEWKTEEILEEEEISIYGSSFSFVLDSNDLPHISVTPNDTLVYLFSDGQKWQKILVDDGDYVRWNNSLVLDSAGKPHIAYTIQTYVSEGTPFHSKETLYYTFFDGNSWQKEMIDDEDHRIRSLSLTLGPENAPIAFYLTLLFEQTEHLRLTSKNDAEWTIETIAQSKVAGKYCSIALDSKDRPHIAYLDETNKALKHAVLNWNSWQIETVDNWNSTDDETCLSLGADDRVHIVYSSSNNIKYAKLVDNQGWKVETVDNGLHPSMVIDGQGNVHIAYQVDNSQGDNSVKYAYLNNDSWEIASVIEENYLWTKTAIALDKENRVFISYTRDNMLETAIKKDDGTWQIETIDGDGNESVTGKFSITSDTEGRVHLGYSTDVLKHACYENGEWTIENLQVSMNFTDFIIDNEGILHFCFTDPFLYHGSEYYYRLAYGSYDGTNFKKVVVDDDGIEMGRYSSLAMGSRGDIHISYYNGTGGCLKYATSGNVPDCPLEATVENIQMLKSLRALRDDFLSTSQAGKRYIQLYYLHASEILSMLLFDHELRSQISGFLKYSFPFIKSLGNKKGNIVFPREIHKIALLLMDKIEAKASPQLKITLTDIRKEIKKGCFLSKIAKRKMY